MNICLLNDSFPPVIDGVANAVMNYGSVLANRYGDRVAVATPFYPDTDYLDYPYEVIPFKSVDTVRLTNGYRAGNPFDAFAIAQMKAIQPDIIHTHCPVSSAIMARILRNTTDAPVVFTYHTKFKEDIAKAVRSEAIQQECVDLLVDNISACDEVWTVSKGAGENLRSLGYQGDWRVMNNGVDFAKGRADQKDVEAATAGYDLPTGVPVFLFVGRIMTYKGIPLILDAMKILETRGRDFRMVFVGGGADLEAMKKKSTESGLDGKVIFTGPVRERNLLRGWNTRADLFLFPSTFDTNGIVVREAAACGLASVLIKGSCAAEGITDGRNGFFIDQSAESLAMLLDRLYSQMERVHEVGQKAMDEIYLSWEDAVGVARERYGEIIDLKAAGRLPARPVETSDYLLKAATSLTQAQENVFHYSTYLYSGMLSNFYNLSQQTDTAIEDAKVRMVEAKEDAKAIVEEAKEDAKARVEDMKNKVEEVKTKLQESREESRERSEKRRSEFKEEASEKAKELQDKIKKFME